jgi:hypothetical protein
MERQSALRRVNLETVDDLLVGAPSAPSDDLFKSSEGGRAFASVDELVLAGNRSFENLDQIDFAGFRNNKDLAAKVLAETRAHLAAFHPEGGGAAFNEDVRRVLNARYLQAHGIQVQAHLDGNELAALRKYFQDQDKSANVADAARAVNAALAGGEQDTRSMLVAAEMGLFAERGVEPEVWSQKFARMDLKALKKARDFVDYYAASESGKYLNAATGENFDAMRDSMARQMLTDRGFQHTEKLDLKTVQTLLWDTDCEGPGSLAIYREAVSRAAAAGETDYLALNIAGNEALLADLGVTPKLLKKLKTSKKIFLASFPELQPQQARAERLKVLRDLLRVLPDAERSAAIVALERGECDLSNAESVLSRYLGGRIRWHGNGRVPSKGMGAMQRANLVSALAKLPDQVKETVFRGPSTSVVRRLEQVIEERFGIEVHRQAGAAPVADQSYGPFTTDWTVQGLADLYNGLSAMSKNGKLPPGLAGTTTVSFMQGGPDSPSMIPVKLRPDEEDPFQPHDRPGASSHKAGLSGFYGEASANERGHDWVVLCDDALMDSNSVGIVGQTLGERTVLHEFAHAVQLGGTPDVGSEETRQAENRKTMAEWSSLSGWTESDGQIADSKQGDHEYYYDPGVKVQNRHQVSTSYGATDPCEDFAEYAPFFFKDPETAMRLSAEKFLYTNRLMGDFYSSEQLQDVAHSARLGASALVEAAESLREKVASAPELAGLSAEGVPLVVRPFDVPAAGGADQAMASSVLISSL